MRDHLLYLDITNACTVRCRHCMYGESRLAARQDLHPTDFALSNLVRLSHHPETASVVISGEGEPLGRPLVVESLMGCLPASCGLQIVTSGNWPGFSVQEGLQFLNGLSERRGERCRVRISSDSYHFERVELARYLDLLKATFIDWAQYPLLDISFRSLVEERRSLRQKIDRLMGQLGLSPHIEQTGPLNDRVLANGRSSDIQYKSMVWPLRAGCCKPFAAEEYIAALEATYGRPFTFGNMASPGQGNGLDLTVKPNGDVYFYGAETDSFGNIFCDSVSIDFFRQVVATHPIIGGLYRKPFRQILRAVCRDDSVAQMLGEINNPYWMVKWLWQHDPGILVEALAER